MVLYTILSMSQSIRDLISPLQILSKSEILNVSKSFKNVLLKKHDYLVEKGAYLDQIVFLKKGILRSGSNQDQDSDVLQSNLFTFENNFLFLNSSLLTSIPLPHSIHALIDSEILVLTRAGLDGIYESVPGFVAVLRQLTQDEIENEEKLAVLKKIQAPQKRYDYFQRNFALIAAQLPENQLASFLHIPASELSRIRKKISVGSAF
jgi:CRP-like cAMP-binding protein